MTTTTEVPGRYPVALNGIGVMVDLSDQEFTRRPIPKMRPQADTASSRGEGSVNPDGLWRFVQDSWHKGAGQQFNQLPDSEPSRFRKAAGFDVFREPGTLRPLNGATKKKNSANTNLALVTASGYLYRADGNVVEHTSDITVAVPVWTSCNIFTNQMTVVNKVKVANVVTLTTSVAHAFQTGDSVTVAIGDAAFDGVAVITGTPSTTTFTYTLAGADVPSASTSGFASVAETPQSIKSLTSDGFKVYAALGSNGVHETQEGRTWSRQISALSATLVRSVKGRLMAANGQAIYNITTYGAAPSALYTHPSEDWVWVDFAEGPGQIFAAGYVGDRSLIYRTAIKPDGTALDTPVVAGELPRGEVIRSIKGYLGLLLIGSDQGVRIAVINGDGDLTTGGLIETFDPDVPGYPSPVRCFEPQGRFVWFGWDNKNTEVSAHPGSGLGRLDLSTFSEAEQLVPAYNEDLDYVTASGAVTGVVTYQNRKVFAIASEGFIVEDGAPAAAHTATFWSGRVNFALTDKKVPHFLHLAWQPMEGTANIGVNIATDGGDLVAVTTVAVAQDSTGAVVDLRTALPSSYHTFEVVLVVARSTGTPGIPYLTRWALEADPIPPRAAEVIVLPIDLTHAVEWADNPEPVGPREVFEQIRSWYTAGTVIDLQMGGRSAEKVTVMDYRWKPREPTAEQPPDWWQGPLVVELKTVEAA